VWSPAGSDGTLRSRRLRITSWNTDSYRRYASALERWAEKLPRAASGPQPEADGVGLVAQLRQWFAKNPLAEQPDEA